MSASAISTHRRLVGSLLIALISCLKVESFGRSFLSSSLLPVNNEFMFTKSPVTGDVRVQMQQRLDLEPDETAGRNEIVVASEIDLPFSAEIAYEAFSDMSRQTSWSPWLQSVEYTDESQNATRWKMKYLGVSTSWVSICTYERRPHTICWTSVSGLQNRGRVDFLPSVSDSSPTRMKMSMRFQVPRLIAHMFRSSGKVSRMVENQMILPTLERFCQDVLQNDCRTSSNIEEAIPAFVSTSER